MLLSLLLAAATPLPAGATAYITGTLSLSQYRTAVADLNGDGSPEVLTYAEGPDYCGRGGCTLFLLSRRSGRWRVVSRMTVTRPPIHLLPTSTKGWRDLSVHVAGGGIVRGYDVRLRFNGRRYPGNPTLIAPRPAGAAPGRILLP